MKSVKDEEDSKERCKEEVWGGYHHRRCYRYAVKDGFCKQHYPDEVAKRKKLFEEKYQKELENSPIIRLIKANIKIKELEKENEMLKKQLNEIYYP